MKNKKLIIGIDLSFNSTGITMTEFDTNEVGKSLGFYRLVFDDESNKFKKYTPTPIINVNQEVYRLPSNINATDIVSDSSDFYSEDQATVTLKAMVCVKRIMKIIVNKTLDINKDGNIDMYVNIEGFIMPSISGVQQFKSLTGLIMLQGMLRSELIKMKLNEYFNIDQFKIYITSPSDLKLWFSGNGSADKQIMLDSFVETYDGNKLLPDTSSLGKINDVIDSFALMLNIIAKLYGTVEIKKKVVKKKTTKSRNKKIKLTVENDILKNSIPGLINI